VNLRGAPLPALWHFLHALHQCFSAILNAQQLQYLPLAIDPLVLLLLQSELAHLLFIILERFDCQLFLLWHLTWPECPCDGSWHCNEFDWLLGDGLRRLRSCLNHIYMFDCDTGGWDGSCALLVCLTFQQRLSLILELRVLGKLGDTSRYLLRRSLRRLGSRAWFFEVCLQLTLSYINHRLATNNVQSFLGPCLWAPLWLNFFGSIDRS
jgi:hypothetical protein